MRKVPPVSSPWRCSGRRPSAWGSPCWPRSRRPRPLSARRWCPVDAAGIADAARCLPNGRASTRWSGADERRVPSAETTGSAGDAHEVDLASTHQEHSPGWHGVSLRAGNPCYSTASSGTGEARSGGCAGDLHHGWYSRTGPVWQRRHEPGLGCDGGLCWWCTGLTRIRRRTYISVTLPVLGGSPCVHRREVKRTRCHGRGDG